MYMHCNLFFLRSQNSDNDEAEKLMQFSKQGTEGGPDEDDGLVVADYVSDEEATTKNR